MTFYDVIIHNMTLCEMMCNLDSLIDQRLNFQMNMRLASGQLVRCFKIQMYILSHAPSLIPTCPTCSYKVTHKSKLLCPVDFPKASGGEWVPTCPFSPSELFFE